MSLRTENSPNCVHIHLLIDKRKYKLIFRGDICLLDTEKIKRYIEKSTGVPVARQKLTFNGQELADNWSGDDIGLYNHAVICLQRVCSPLHDCPDNGESQRVPSLTKSPSLLRERGYRSPLMSSRSLGSPRPWSTKGFPREPAGLEGCVGDLSLPSFEWEADPGARVDPSAAQLGASYGSRGSCHTGRGFCESLLPTHFVTDRNAFQSASSRSRGGSATKLMHGGFAAGACTEAIKGDGEQDGRTFRHEASETEQSLPDRDQSTSQRSMADETESAQISLSSSKASFACRGQRYAISKRIGNHEVGSLLFDRGLPALKAENQALSRENELLQEKLLEAERRAASATLNWQLREEVLELKAALEAAEKDKQRAVDKVQALWHHKETELVAEMHLLRKECEQARATKRSLGDEQQGQITSLQSQLQSQRDEIRTKEETIRQLHFTLAELQSKQDPREASPVLVKSLDELVQGSLVQMSKVLEIPPIKLDDKGTCVISMSDELNIFLTLDSETERLHVYAMLLNELPVSVAVRLQLYEKLLEGALLGRNTAGGTIGISKEDGVVLLSFAIDVRHSDEGALARLVYSFVESVKHWHQVIKDMLTIP